MYMLLTKRFKPFHVKGFSIFSLSTDMPLPQILSYGLASNSTLFFAPIKNSLSTRAKDIACP